jgi:hypothetical protein
MYPGSDNQSQFPGSPLFAKDWRMRDDDAAIVPGLTLRTTYLGLQ